MPFDPGRGTGGYNQYNNYNNNVPNYGRPNQANTPRKKNNLPVIIAVVVIIVLLLIGLFVGLSFLKSDSEKNPTSNNSVVDQSQYVEVEIFNQSSTDKE